MKKYLPLVFILAFAGCNLNFLEKKGRIPKLDTSFSLAGVDANKDGIRDDIEQWIEKRYKNEPKKKAAVRQLAKSAQLTVIADLHNEQMLKKIDKIESRAIHCMHIRFTDMDVTSENNPSNIIKEVTAYTENTLLRMFHSMKYAQKFDGAVFALPKGDTCDD